MERIVLNVDGMSCSHCEKRVKNAVGALRGVRGAQVDLANKTVTVEFDPTAVTVGQIKDAVEEQGYDVR